MFAETELNTCSSAEDSPVDTCEVDNDFIQPFQQYLPAKSPNGAVCTVQRLQGMESVDQLSIQLTQTNQSCVQATGKKLCHYQVAEFQIPYAYCKSWQMSK